MPAMINSFGIFASCIARRAGSTEVGLVVSSEVGFVVSTEGLLVVSTETGFVVSSCACKRNTEKRIAIKKADLRKNRCMVFYSINLEFRSSPSGSQYNACFKAKKRSGGKLKGNIESVLL